MFRLIILLFVHQGIISKRLDLGDFILHGNWTITAVYGHQVFHFPCFILFIVGLNDINISRNETRFKIRIYIVSLDEADLVCILNLLNV